MANIIIAVLQALLVILLAPFFSGFSRWLRARMHSRKGPGIMQDYHDIAKLFKREDVHSAESSFVHRFTPILFIATMLALTFGVPMIIRVSPIPVLGDIILVIYLLALSRFFFGLCAIDSGDTYAGLGGVRELLVGVLIEPAMMLSLVVVALATGTTYIGGMGYSIGNLVASSPIGVIVAGVAFAIACYVETGKIPFDLAEAEQEIQEGPLAEYSGPSLALMKIGMSMKQIIVVSWFFAIFIPWGSALPYVTSSMLSYDILSVLLGIVVWFLKMVVFFGICGFVENALIRVRYKFLGKKTWAIVGLSACAFLLCILGI